MYTISGARISTYFYSTNKAFISILVHILNDNPCKVKLIKTLVKLLVLVLYFYRFNKSVTKYNYLEM